MEGAGTFGVRFTIGPISNEWCFWSKFLTISNKRFQSSLASVGGRGGGCFGGDIQMCDAEWREMQQIER